MNSRIFFSFHFRGGNRRIFRRLFRFCSSSSSLEVVVVLSETMLNLLLLAAISISAALLRARLSSSPPYRRRRGRCLFDSSSTFVPFRRFRFARHQLLLEQAWTCSSCPFRYFDDDTLVLAQV